MTDRRDDQDEDFASLLAEFERDHGQPERKGPQPGDTVKGAVVAIGRDKLFVDLGGRAEATLELEDVSDADGELRVRVGDEIEARVVAVGRDGSVALRRSLGRGPDAAAELESAYAAGLPVEGLVVASNKGGFEVQVAGLRGFCPISQIELRFVEDPEAHVGKRYEFRITKLEGGRRPNLVLSRRALLEEESRARAEELKKQLRPGAVFTGTVTSIKPYGAFVDLGGLEGLIHVSELSFQRVDDPADMLSVGQSVDVQVLALESTPGDKRSERIKLSMRALKQDPWEDEVSRIREGTRVRGQVVKLESFGAFVELAPGVEGLVHVSEIPSGKRLTHARQVLSLGESVEASVLSIDRERRRIALSIKSAGEAAAAEARAQEPREHREAPGKLGTLGDLLKGKL
jgi:small subunit ribosomal protein S1